MNIDKTLAKHLRAWDKKEPPPITNTLHDCLFTYKEVKAAIKEIIEETLRMASESAQAEFETQPYGDDIAVVDKKSILNVIKQIEI